MCQRYRRGFTAAEKTELWDRWQRGESLKEIGRAFGKPSSSIHLQVSRRVKKLKWPRSRSVKQGRHSGAGDCPVRFWGRSTTTSPGSRQGGRYGLGAHPG